MSSMFVKTSVKKMWIRGPARSSIYMERNPSFDVRAYIICHIDLYYFSNEFDSSSKRGNCLFYNSIKTSITSLSFLSSMIIIIIIIIYMSAKKGEGDSNTFVSFLVQWTLPLHSMCERHSESNSKGLLTCVLLIMMWLLKLLLDL
jgi:hypothetical protein